MIPLLFEHLTRYLIGTKNFFLVRVYTHGRQRLRRTVSQMNTLININVNHYEMKSLTLPHYVNTPTRIFHEHIKLIILVLLANFVLSYFCSFLHYLHRLILINVELDISGIKFQGCSIAKVKLALCY